MSVGLLEVVIIMFGLVGLFGPVMAGIYLAAKLNGRR